MPICVALLVIFSKGPGFWFLSPQFMAMTAVLKISLIWYSRSKFNLLFSLFSLSVFNILLISSPSYSKPLREPCSEIDQNLLYSSALENFIAKDFIKSISLYKDVLQCNPSFPAAFIGLGRNYQEIGMKDESLAAYNKAISLDKLNGRAFSNRGLVKASLGRLDDAILDFNQSISLDPSSYIAFTNRGVAFASLGKLKEAKKNFDQALLLNSSYGEAFINRGIVYELLGNLLFACSDWKKAITLRQFAARPWVASQCDK